MTDITKFFEALSWRAYKENDLSDVTFAMCEADPLFKQFFLDFFFGGQGLIAGSCTIAREVSYDGSRPDIVIQDARRGVYFVEVKIWDCNHHFNQYSDTLVKQCGVQGDVHNHFGYISAYVIQSKEESFVKMEKGGRIKTWKNLFEALERYSYFDNIHVRAYAEYVKRVCAIDDYKVDSEWGINVKDFTYIQSFDEKIQSVISSPNDMGLQKYTTPRRFRSCEWMGHFFEWTYSLSNGKKEKVWGWVGVRYEKQKAVLCVEFEDRPGWGKVICDKHPTCIKGGVLRCYAKDDNVWNLDDGSALKGFLEASFSWALECPEKDYDDKVTVESCEASGNKAILAMKNLPIVLRAFLDFDQKQCDSLAKAEYDIVLAEGNDAESPQSHCGRYFHIRRKGSDTYVEGQDYFRGWVGVQYSKSCWRRDENDNKKKYSESPAFVVEVRKDFACANTPEGWKENSWGWIAKEIDIDARVSYSDCLEKARKALVELVKSKKETEDANVA